MESIQTLIKHYIEINGYTIYSISTQSGVNRTTLQKVLSGQRKITKEIYERLLPYFSLSPLDKEELDQAFLIEQIGQERFQTHMEIKRILELPSSALYQNATHASDISSINIEKLEDQAILHGTYEIVNLIYSLALYNVSNNTDPFLYTFADLSHPYVPIFFRPLYNDAFRSLTVNHLVEYQKTLMGNENYDNLHNLKILSNLLPSFSEFPGKFSVYYYYAGRHDFMNQACVFPFYIITNTHVVLLSSNYETALFVSNPATHAHFLAVYKDVLAKSNCLTFGAQSPLDLLTSLNGVDPNANYPLCLNIQPTIEKYLTPEMIDKYMLPSPYQNAIREKLLERISQLTMENHTILFTMEGLKLFAEQGKNVNFPDSLAAHFDIPDRIYLLRQFLKSNQNEHDNHFLLLNPAKLHTSLNISIAFTPPSSTYLMLLRRDGTSMVIPLSEHTLCYSIMDFIQTLPQYGYVCSIEETNRFLQDEIENLENLL